MSAFSFTAPYITPEEEQSERESLTEEEQQQLKSDVFGHDNGVVVESSGDFLSAQMLIEEALQEFPASQSCDYYEAKQRVPPAVMERESNPLLFLQRESNDPKAAAKRLAEYWKQRRTLFGDERAFLPMTLEGAMADDTDALSKGVISVMPPDKKQRAVIFWDRIRSVQSVISRDSLLRVVFYTIQTVVVDQHQGYVLIVNLKGMDLYLHFDRILAKKVFAIMRDAMPIPLKAYHTCIGSAQSVAHLILPIMKQIAGKQIRLHMITHAGSDKDILDELRVYGIYEQNLSHAVGGALTYQDYLTWLDQRAMYEQQYQNIQQQQHHQHQQHSSNNNPSIYEQVVVE